MAHHTPPIRVLIADDHQFFRRSLCLACELDGDLEVAGEAENGQEAVELARRLRPDVVLMDIKMPILDGVQATGAICNENPATRVIVLTIDEQDELLWAAFAAGACGYLCKNLDEQAMFQVIRAVHQGKFQTQTTLSLSRYTFDDL
jgi:DNA-binding NarL/FixJ family response regulator